MSIYAKSEHHIVTVRTETELGDVYLESIEFTCTAPEDAPCRTYPDMCGCERFTEDDDNPGHDLSGHPYVSGLNCWVKEWFDADPDGEATIYAGADRDEYASTCGMPLVDRTGHVNIVGFDDCGPEWEWAS